MFKWIGKFSSSELSFQREDQGVTIRRWHTSWRNIIYKPIFNLYFHPHFLDSLKNYLISRKKTRKALDDAHLIAVMLQFLILLQKNMLFWYAFLVKRSGGFKQWTGQFSRNSRLHVCYTCDTNRCTKRIVIKLKDFESKNCLPST